MMSMSSGLSHRETLLGQLTSYLRSLRDNYTTLISSQPHLPSHSHAHSDPAQIAAAEKLAPPTGKNLPQVVNNIVWTRQLEAKVHVNTDVVCVSLCVSRVHVHVHQLYIAGTFLHVSHLSRSTSFPFYLLSPPISSPLLPPLPSFPSSGVRYCQYY